VCYSPPKLARIKWHDVYTEAVGRQDATPPFGAGEADQVRWLQSRLNAAGYFAGPVTGDIGHANRRASTQAFGNALRRYRIARRVPLDGVTVPLGAPTLARGDAPALQSADWNTLTAATAADLRYAWRAGDYHPADGAARQDLTLLTRRSSSSCWSTSRASPTTTRPNGWRAATRRGRAPRPTSSSASASS
jgi:peptidoglycan hydrolase-like protein with peptidoglycan-binding domain